MKLPSDEEWRTALQESEKAFRKALAMPNKTVVEVLIQGAELLNAIGAKALFLMGEQTMLEKGVIYEDELEARAAIGTFREACSNVLGAFDEVLRALDSQRK
jgi:hypothetical protein